MRILMVSPYFFIKTIFIFSVFIVIYTFCWVCVLHDEFVHSTEDKGQKESCNDQAWLFAR